MKPSQKEQSWERKGKQERRPQVLAGLGSPGVLHSRNQKEPFSPLGRWPSPK